MKKVMPFGTGDHKVVKSLELPFMACSSVIIGAAVLTAIKIFLWKKT
jgi:hypothetical protein